MNAQAKLTTIWKALNVQDHPFNLKMPEINIEDKVSRSKTNGQIPTQGYSNLTKSTFISDSILAWNKAPEDIKKCKSLSGAKTLIKKFAQTLPGKKNIWNLFPVTQSK